MIDIEHDKILVTIVIPCYNDHLFILEALESALNQTYVTTEIIIVDDGSNEITKRVLAAVTDSKVKVISQKNKGLSAARNVGIKEAKGEYILLLDSDDKFEKTFVEKAVVCLKNNKHIGVVSCWGYRFIGDKILNSFKPIGGGIANFLFNNAAIGTSMLRKKCWEEVQGYDEQMKKGYEDWEFYIRVSQKWNVEIIKEYLFYYRQRDDSMRVVAMSDHDKTIKAYIYNKHKDLYIKNYNKTISFFLNEIDKNKKEYIKQKKQIDFKLGKLILSPIRFLKAILASGK